MTAPFEDHDRVSDHRLSDGTTVRLRRLRPEDRERLREGFERLSPESRFLRFLTPTPRLTEAMLRYLTETDDSDHVAIGAVELRDDGSEGEGLGVARFVRLREDLSIAEAAVAVIDARQGLGIGHLLLEELVRAARLRGVRVFRGYVSPANQTVRQLLAEVGDPLQVRRDDELLVYDVALPELPEAELRGGPVYRLLRAAARGLEFLFHSLRA